MKQMVEAYNEVGGNLISVLEVPEEEVSSYGVIAPGQARRRAHRSARSGRKARSARMRPPT
jgi:UTP--glucose-1-phosphate uridylyltransferase